MNNLWKVSVWWLNLSAFLWSILHEICGRQPLKNLCDMVCLSRPYHLKSFKGCLPQIVLDPFLNIMSQIHAKWGKRIIRNCLMDSDKSTVYHFDLHSTKYLFGNKIKRVSVLKLKNKRNMFFQVQILIHLKRAIIDIARTIEKLNSILLLQDLE